MWSNNFTLLSAEVILVLVLLLWLAYKYFTSNYTYWKDRSVPYIEPHFPFGTEKDIVFSKVPFGEHYQSYYDKFKNEKMVGGFMVNTPFLLLRDPGLIKQVMIKDFNHFVDRDFVDPELLSPVNRDLFVIGGDAWRNMRTKLTPAFTSGKMKLMFNLIEACAEEFRKGLKLIADKNGKLDMKDFMARFTTDVISSCAFGLESNSIKNPDSEFRQNGKKLFDKPPGIEFIKQQMAFTMPNIYKLLHLSHFNTGTDDFFRNIVHDTVEYREKSGIVRHDFIDLILKIKNNKRLSDDDKGDTGSTESDRNSEPGLTLDEMTAQAVVFFAAGFETAASTMTFCVYELARNPDVQERLYKEIDDVIQRHAGKVNYQALQEIPYLEAVVNETLRLYVSLPILHRKCTKEYKVPDSDLVIPKGMKLIIPTYAIHHDPKYYPEPFKFDPERFMGDSTAKVKGSFTFLPFGEGPRMCIGSRFGWLQIKTCLSMMIKNFRISLTEETPVPIVIDKQIFFTAPDRPIVLKISNRGK